MQHFFPCNKLLLTNEKSHIFFPFKNLKKLQPNQERHLQLVTTQIPIDLGTIMDLETSQKVIQSIW